MHNFRGSLCFNIPLEVFIDKNVLWDGYYKEVLPYIDNKKRCFEQKNKLVEKFKPSFPDASATMKCPDEEEKNNYKSRFLCHCFSVAEKFLDDKDHGNHALQFFLGKYEISYRYLDTKNRIKDFTFNICFSLHSWLRKYNTKLEIETNILLHISFEKLSAEDIIFMKHLFYKKKLKCYIDNENISIMDWVVNKLKDIDKIINPIGDKNIYDPYEDFRFDNSLLELYPLEMKEEDLHLNAVNYGDKYAALLYGLITSDESWKFIDEQEAVKRLKTKWSLRPFKCVYFIRSNGLILNTPGLAREHVDNQLAIFHRYQYDNTEGRTSQKYIEYCKLQPCVSGVKSMILFTFQDVSYQKRMITRAIKKVDNALSDTKTNKSTRAKELRKHQNNLFKLIERNTFGASEMVNIQSLLVNSSSFPQLIEHLKEKYNRTVILLENENAERTNKIIRILTYCTVGIGIIQIILILRSIL